MRCLTLALKARDDGTMSAANSTLEVKLSKKNSISCAPRSRSCVMPSPIRLHRRFRYSDMVATKMDAHVIYDSEAPRLLTVHPPHNAFGAVAPAKRDLESNCPRAASLEVGAEVNISLTFNEDIQDRPAAPSAGSVCAESMGVLARLATGPSSCWRPAKLPREPYLSTQVVELVLA